MIMIPLVVLPLNPSSSEPPPRQRETLHLVSNLHKDIELVFQVRLAMKELQGSARLAAVPLRLHPPDLVTI